MGCSADERTAVSIEGLTWLERSPSFESIAIDERGTPLRMVAVDPRVFAAHKFWVSTRTDRDPLKRKRDYFQAEAVGTMVSRYFQHLSYQANDLHMLPQKVFRAAQPLFVDHDEEAVTSE